MTEFVSTLNVQAQVPDDPHDLCRGEFFFVLDAGVRPLSRTTNYPRLQQRTDIHVSHVAICPNTNLYVSHCHTCAFRGIMCVPLDAARLKAPTDVSASYMCLTEMPAHLE